MRAFSDYYGATVPLKLTRGLGTVGPALEPIGAAVCAAFAGFASAAALGTFGTFASGGVFVFVVSAAAAACLAALGLSGREGQWRRPVGACGSASVLAGWVLGRHGYCTYGYYALYYSNSRAYENVDPTQRGATVADGARLAFAAEARLDVDASVGHRSEDGVTYCAAPVVGLDPPVGHIDFWAVGIDCCAPVGGFHCDAALVDGARGGAVVLDRPSCFLGMLCGEQAAPDALAARTGYEAARSAAEGALTWGAGAAAAAAGGAALGAPADAGSAGGGGAQGATLYASDRAPAVFVEWVTNHDLALVPHYYRIQAWLFVMLSAVACAFLSVPCAMYLSRPPSASRGPTGMRAAGVV